MITPEQYKLCEPILTSNDLEDEDKVEQVEDILRSEAKLKGKALEDAVLDAMWKHRNAERGEEEQPMRHTVVRRSSPAPWQAHRAPTPTGSPKPSSSPALGSAFPVGRPSFSRARSTASPFASPKPSPRMAVVQLIPHSPSLNRYEFSTASPAPPDAYDDFDSDYIDSLLDDDAASITSVGSGITLNAAASEWVPPQSSMSTFDMLRNVLGDQLSDDQIESVLEENNFDLASTMAALYATHEPKPKDTIDNIDGNILVGKSMAAQPRPGTPGTAKSPIVCKYWLASGSCLRADCRFAHDTGGYLCKYWMQGHCLAADNCQFSHDPSVLISGMNVNDTSPARNIMHDSPDQFPSLGGGIPSGPRSNATQYRPGYHGGQGGSNSRSYRPGSRHSSRPTTPSSLSMDDPDAFPTLGSAPSKRGSKHHGNRSRRGGAANSEENIASPSSLADIVKMSSPSSSPAQLTLRKAAHNNTRNPGGRGTDFGKTIPEPKHIPWLETGNKANEQYLRHRAEAIKHGSIRNKFLQSAAQAWNRNDARAAKALSLRGQAENEEMRKAHRAAAEALYAERNAHLATIGHEEWYIDLHGLHPEEAIDYLEDIMLEHRNPRSNSVVLYAITGTGHHSKNGKDKVGKGVRQWLNEGGYTYREFSVPGERGGYIGGVLGVDVLSGKPVKREPKEIEGSAKPTMATVVGGGKVQVMKRGDVVS